MARIRSLNCRKCTIASGVRILNCAGPGTASNSFPKIGGILRCFALIPNLTTEVLVLEVPSGL
eukprot:13372602-Alexandrium_andersonii.AAC.1